MSVYTVHAPEAGEVDPDRFVFVRDGFHFWAFVFGPLWLLSKRQWIAFVIYVGVALVLNVALWLIGVPRVAHGVITFLLHLLVAMEAATVQRWTLSLRNWTELGLVTADRYEMAERRFFDMWTARTARAESPSSPPQSIRMPLPTTDIIGFFPEPQSRQ